MSALLRKRPTYCVTTLRRFVPKAAVSNCSKAPPLFDHLVGDIEQRRWHGEAKHSGGLGIDDQLKLGRLCDRQVCGLGPLEDAAAINADLTPRIREIAPVTYQPASFGKLAPR